MNKKESIQNYLVKLTGRHRNDLLYKFPHFLNYGLNLSERPIENYKKFPLNISYPLPIYYEYNEDVNEIDIAFRLVKKKMEFSTKLKQLKQAYNKNKRKKKFLEYEENDFYSTEVIMFMRALETDVDPYFSGSYDYYFTGGSMEIINTLDEQFLIHTVNSDLDTIRIDSYTASDNLNESEKFQISPLKMKNHIYEIIKENGKFNVTSQFAARQKNIISIFSIMDSVINKSIELTSDVPFLSGAFYTDVKNIFCSVDAEKIINIWDLNSGFVIDSRDLKLYSHNSNDNWSSLANYEKQIFMYADRCDLRLFDLRLPFDTNILKSSLCIKNSVEICEQISCIGISDFGNLLYVGTDHNLFGLDIRYIKENFNVNPTTKFTHGLLSPPIILKTLMYNDCSELILLSSPLSGDVRICTNTTDNMNYYSEHLPYKPYSIKDTYNFAQTSDKCIDPTNFFQEHFNLCTAGIALYKNHDKIFILSQNTTGDIFKQICTEDEMWMNDIPDKLEEWQNKLTNSKKHFNVTDMTNMAPLVSILNKKQNNEINPEETVIDEHLKIKRRPKWRKPLRKLKSYGDFLASDLLSAWEIETQENDELNDTGNQEERITEWLNVNTFEITKDNMDDENKFNSLQSKIEENERIYDSQMFSDPTELYQGDQMNNINIATMLMPGSQSQQKKKSSQKTKYVQGF